MSLTHDDLEDIKHLMEVTVGTIVESAVKELKAEFKAEMDERFNEVDMKMDTILDAIGTEFNDQREAIDNHERRIVRLEKKAA